MITEKIREYTKKKVLSNKAKLELLEILKEIDFENTDEIHDIVTELLNLNASILSDFVFHLDKETSNAVVKEIDCNNANKALHIYMVVISLGRIGNKETASCLLERFISNSVLDKKVNKQVYIGLEKALNCEGSDILTAECINWVERNKNCFRNVWVGAAGYIQNDEFAKHVLKWFENNHVVMVEKERALILKTKNSNESQEYKDSPVALSELGIDDLLRELAKKIGDLKKIGSERDELSSICETLKNENSKLKKDFVRCELEKGVLVKSKEELGEEKAGLEKQVCELRDLLKESRDETRKTQSKLSNVESAYGQAGQTQVDLLVGKIKKRLSSEYEKYLEIKTKEPDMDYYDVLMAMLDEVYRVLKKNGITFEENYDD